MVGRLSGAGIWFWGQTGRHGAKLAGAENAAAGARTLAGGHGQRTVHGSASWAGIERPVGKESLE